MESLLAFFRTDTGFATSFSAIATLIAAVLTHLLRGRVNLITFSPNSTYFQLRSEDANNPLIHVRSGQIIVQNLGRRSAKNVQLTSAPGAPPAGYVVLPSLVHSTRMGPNGEWILEIPFIAAKEVITVQILNGPNIDSVRSEDGFAKVVPVIYQRLFPKHIQFVFASLESSTIMLNRRIPLEADL